MPLDANPISEANSPESSGGCQILLIEDNADSRMSMALLLKLVGHQVVTAEDGKHGLAAARAAPPDVVFIDIGLPDMDGFEVARHLRTFLKENVYLVALTGFNAPEDRQRALDAGFNVHLTKPADLKTLEELLASRSGR